MRRPPLSRVAGFALGSAVAFVILAVEVPPARPLWLGLAAIAGIAGTVLSVVALRQSSRSAPSDEAAIRARGILGRAIVIAAIPTGRRRGQAEEVDLTLEVQLPTRRRFEIRRRDWLEPRERAMIVVGRPIVVAAAPDEPGHVVPVLDIPEVDEAAIDALGPVAGGPGGPRRRLRDVSSREGEREARR
jgi:hypothetical protein